MNNTGAGMAMGIAIGVALGVALDNIAIGIVLGVAMGAAFEAQNKKKAKEKEELDAQTNNPANAAKAAEKDAHLEQVLAFAKSRESVTNKDIQQLLSVSDVTAERYLDELEKDGKLQQIGKTGQSVIYKAL